MVRKIAVCDDEAESRRQISLCLSRFEQESGDTFEISFFSSGEALLSGLAANIDVILLDIQMSGISGMNVAHALRDKNINTPIIFITSKVEYALDGYEVHAYAFLRKPVNYEAIKRHLNELFANTDKKAQAKFTIDYSGGVDVIDCNKLIYAEVYGHDCTLIFDTEKRTYPITLLEIESKTLQYGFFRCHKSYLVNMSKIEKIGADTITVSNREELPLSKHRKKEFMESYAQFMGAML